MSWTAERRLLAMALALLVVSTGAPPLSSAQTDAPPPAAQVTPDPWPKLFTISGSSGRGPTMLMSPRSTFQSCGNSSRLVLRRKWPMRVMRGSFLSL